MSDLRTFQLPEPPSRKKIMVGTIVAIIVASVLLVTAILPAEYGIDPLGIGRALGLTAVFEAGTAAAPAQTLQTGPSPTVSPSKAPFLSDTRVFKLGPLDSVEFKYRLEKGAGMLFAWKATDRVFYEFHGEPDGAKEGYADTYDKADATASNGTFNAPNPGIHGWYWENVGPTEVTIELKAVGFFSFGQIFRSDGTTEIFEFPAQAVATDSRATP